jgi:hypothetical protein
LSKRWRFEHDSFEEFFAATYIIRSIRNGRQPDLSAWNITEAQTESFLGVIEFLGELADQETLDILLNANLPELWKTSLQSNLKDS